MQISLFKLMKDFQDSLRNFLKIYILNFNNFTKNFFVNYFNTMNNMIKIVFKQKPLNIKAINQCDENTKSPSQEQFFW